MPQGDGGHVFANWERSERLQVRLWLSTISGMPPPVSYGRTVPKGWTRGEPLQAYGTRPRYALCRDITPDPGSAGVPMDEEFMITFDSHEDVTEWLKWWRSPPTPRGEPER